MLSIFQQKITRDRTDYTEYKSRITSGVSVPEKVKEADILTHYAVQSRYPSWVEEVTRDEYREVLELAARVVFWAESVIS